MLILQHPKITDYGMLVSPDKKLLYIILMSDDRYGQYLKKPLQVLENYFSSCAPFIQINPHGFLKNHIQTEHRALRHYHFLHTFSLLLLLLVSGTPEP